jgi:septal ring factor EnvC (AmiA/AmiB activator)
MLPPGSSIEARSKLILLAPKVNILLPNPSFESLNSARTQRLHNRKNLVSLENRFSVLSKKEQQLTFKIDAQRRKAEQLVLLQRKAQKERVKVMMQITREEKMVEKVKRSQVEKRKKELEDFGIVS